MEQGEALPGGFAKQRFMGRLGELITANLRPEAKGGHANHRGDNASRTPSGGLRHDWTEMY